VVLRDPEGPSREKNSPSRPLRLTPSTATTSPKVLRTPSSRTSAEAGAGCGWLAAVSGSRARKAVDCSNAGYRSLLSPGTHQSIDRAGLPANYPTFQPLSIQLRRVGGSCSFPETGFPLYPSG